VREQLSIHRTETAGDGERLSHSGEAVMAGRAGLPEELVSKVLEMMQPAGQDGGWGFTQSSATVRLVSSQWRAMHDALVTRLVLRPETTDEAVGMLVKRFPAVVSIERKFGDWDVLTNAGLRALSNPPALTFLDISFCNKVTNEGLRAVSSLPKLTSLNICGWGRVTDEGLRAVSSLPALTFLDISSCEEVTDVGARAVSNLPALTSLNLRDCSKVTNEGVLAVSNLHALTSLNLGGCYKVTDDGVRAVSCIPALTFLDIGWCNVTAAGVQALRIAARNLHIKSNKRLRAAPP
jgi:hypothetical protein